ncbi:UDP-glucose dehydrogenase family protein [Gordonia alkanivorans]|uniref:UDP-glucose dehydrogenase family protein n=1 Tax=Gordonia alkanivorans TaxID=84096 RepID=UPI00244C0EF1|nr:UDP-glucose/GDP-mannose dehydrogenase family protein [Gordonia alkanivorans]MDH3009316.1 UDP-glucose/GDP-mannose dehydrogenase family protein [Gordonia alkanivorans]
MKIVVVGLGYLGATHAACMAELGHDVLGLETDVTRLEALRAGRVPFYEPELEVLLQSTLESGKLRVTQSYQEAADWGDAFFIAVGTPQRKGEYAADLRYVESVIEELVPLIQRDCVIFGKSTVPVGTCARLADRAAELAKDVVVEVAWNPEFLREGHAVQDTLRPDRLVLGTDAEGGLAVVYAQTIYKSLLESGIPFLVMDCASAELVKVAANAFLATKISFINAIAEVSEAAGADVNRIAEAIGYDERIGNKFLKAGIGFGGGCLPKDIRAFMARAGELGAAEALGFLREVDNINMRRRNRVVDIAKKSCRGSLLNKKIAVLGAAFKPNSDDVRDSPALNIAGQMQLQGSTVVVYDPKAMENSKRLFPTLEYASSVADACDNADLVMVLTEWGEFTEIDPIRLREVVREATVVDGRFCLDRDRWVSAGWTYHA